MKNPFRIQEDVGDLEQLQYRIAMVMAGFAFFSMIFFGVSDYLMGLSQLIIKLRIATVLFLGVSFFLLIKFKLYFIAMNYMLAFILASLVLNYFYNDGFRGPTIFILYVVVVVAAIFFKRPLNLIWFTLCIGLYLTVFYLESIGQIQVEKNYSTSQDLFLDNTISIFVTSIFILIGVKIVVFNYKKQNIALTKLKEANDKNLRELQSLNDKKNQLIALLSHDLKNPVASLAQTLELVDSKLITKNELGQILTMLKKQSVHLSHVLSNTLSWILTEMGEQELEVHPVEVSRLMTEIGELMESQALRKSQRIEKVISVKDLTINLAEKEIKIILRNYLDNAIKFSSPGSVIYLEFFQTKNSYRWNVKNYGPRIPKEKANHLFDFTLKSSPGTQKEIGTGLGLGLCKRIAARIGFEVGHEYSSDGCNVFFLEKNQETSHSN